MLKKTILVGLVTFIGSFASLVSAAPIQPIKEEILVNSLKDVTNQTKEEIDRRKALVDLIAAIEKTRGDYYWWDLLAGPGATFLATFFVLAMAVPLVNYLYWRRQKKFEEERAKKAKMIELFSDSAQLFTQFLQTMLWLDGAVAEEQSVRGKPEPDAVEVDGAAKARRDWARARLDVEPKISRLLREIPIYFGNDSISAAKDIRDFYHNLKGPICEPEVHSFQNLIDELVNKMGPDIKKRIGG